MIWPVLDRVALAGMAAGLLLILQPYWSGGLRAGFFCSLVFTLAHIFTSRKRAGL